MSLRARLEGVRKDTKEKEFVVVKDQISALESERDELKKLLEDLRSNYERSGKDLEDLKYNRRVVSDLYDEYAEDLASQGIEDKSALIKSATEEEEVIDYRKSEEALRSGVSELSKTKKELKSKVPDLNFRGGKSSTEEGDSTPREESIAKIESKIAEIDTQIEDLKANNPDLDNEEKIAECIAAMKSQNFESLAERFIPRITKETVINHALIGQFKGEFSSKQITEALSSIVSEVLRKKRETDPEKFSDENVSNIEEALRKEIRAYLAYETKESLSRDPEIFEAKRRVEDAERDISFKESAHEEFVKLKLKYQDALGESVEIRKGFRTTEKIYGPSISFERKSIDIQTERSQKESMESHLSVQRAELDSLKSRKPGFFGKKRHSEQIEELETDIDNGEKLITEMEEKIKEAERRNKILSQELDDVGKLLFESKIFSKWDGKDYSKKTLGEVFEFMEGVFDNLKTEVDPNDLELSQKYTRALEAYRAADKEYAAFLIQIKSN